MQHFLIVPVEKYRTKVLEWCQEFHFDVLDNEAGIQFFIKRELLVIKYILRNLGVCHHVHSYY